MLSVGDLFKSQILQRSKPGEIVAVLQALKGGMGREWQESGVPSEPGCVHRLTQSLSQVLPTGYGVATAVLTLQRRTYS